VAEKVLEHATTGNGDFGAVERFDDLHEAVLEEADLVKQGDHFLHNTTIVILTTSLSIAIMVEVTSLPESADEVAARLGALLSRQVRGMELDGHPQQLTGGFWATLYVVPVRMNGHASRVVVRLMPDGERGRREGVVQAWAADSGVPTPAVFAHGIDEIEGAFIVMEWSPGSPPLGGLTLSTALRDRGASVRRLPGRLADAARIIHRSDIAGLYDALRESGIDPAALDAGRMVAGIEAVAHDVFMPATVRDSFGRVADWLGENRPTATPSVLIHGDLHPFNLLVDGDRTTLVDWTNAAIAPPEADLGLTAALLRCAPVPTPAIARRPVARLTNWLAESFITAYGEGIDRRAVDWWEVVQCARAQAEVATGRTRPGTVVNAGHPFEIAGPAMCARVAQLTGHRLVLPVRST
jgi:aminoglycoside phosphotransferase (APT) family kinase protein